ncbi:MAG: metallophosphoesterase [Gemmatimonadales bacterium]|nr:metallophosphoesterase [Gemmatimonadales bacterium]
MPVVRRFWPAALLAAAGCGGRAPLVLEPAPSGGPVAASLFLIGDAGATTASDRVLVELRRQGRAAPRGSTIVFLGDNVYPRGIPEDTAADYPEARRRLLVQAALADSTGLRVIFVPGNHDWDRHRPTGWAQIQRQERLLRDYATQNRVAVELQPRGGCPGPVTTDLPGSIRLVAIDTQWWLHTGPRPGRATDAVVRTLPDPDPACGVTTEAAFLDSLRRVNAAADRVTVLVGHHPLASHGEHGGHHPWIQYLFPLVPTPIAPWAWLPIGWIYPLGRRLVGHRQDLIGAANQAMRRALEGTFSDRSPFIYAAGHDHSLEVMRQGPGRFYLVSGSGMERHQSAVGRGDSTAFASSRPGFMRVDVLEDQRVSVEVTVIDESNQPRGVYRAWLRSGK